MGLPLVGCYIKAFISSNLKVGIMTLSSLGAGTLGIGLENHSFFYPSIKCNQFSEDYNLELSEIQ